MTNDKQTVLIRHNRCERIIASIDEYLQNYEDKIPDVESEAMRQTLDLLRVDDVALKTILNEMR